LLGRRQDYHRKERKYRMCRDARGIELWVVEGPRAAELSPALDETLLYVTTCDHHLVSSSVLYFPRLTGLEAWARRPAIDSLGTDRFGAPHTVSSLVRLCRAVSLHKPLEHGTGG